jgi:hypothetical protein
VAVGGSGKELYPAEANQINSVCGRTLFENDRATWICNLMRDIAEVDERAALKVKEVGPSTRFAPRTSRSGLSTERRHRNHLLILICGESIGQVM